MKINLDLIKNTVSAENQTRYRAYYSGALDDKNAYRVMFIGNSITLHERKPEIGWTYDHGMAASSPSKDYVHIIRRRLRSFTHKNIASLVYNAGFYEMNFNKKNYSDMIIKYAKEFKPDLIIFRLGENVRIHDLNMDELYKSFDSVISQLNDIQHNLVVTSMFWGYEPIDNMLECLSKKYDLKYAVINDLGEHDENKAIGLFATEGVNLHPGDLGMKRIAERIFNKIKN